MIKKYEIITVGSKKRIKALRSFHVQGRYVNIGDVGGIVYDENTLSQEGNCWIFSGNLNYPSIRVSGDSIVDTNGYEADVTDPRPIVNITGTSALIGAHDFVTGSTADGEPVEAYIDINDSRIEFQYTGAMTVATKVNPGKTASDVLKSVIDTSNVIISKTGNGVFVANIHADVVKCNVTFTPVSGGSILEGIFKNVSNLVLDGTVTWASSTDVKKSLRVYDCYDFLLTSTAIQTATVSAAITANMPFTFTRCNVPNGIFYHNAKSKNVYTDIDFAKANVDLGKIVSGTTYKLVSSEVEGMYRIYDTAGKTYGYLVEAYDSVARLTSMGANSYDTTIYKDAYIGGKFEFAGTNVFGNNVPGHHRARVLNVQPRAVQGDFDTVSKGQTITGANGAATVVCIPEAFRISGSKGILISGAPAGIEVSAVFVSANNTIISASGWATTPWTPSPVALAYEAAYLRFRKAEALAGITPEDLAGVTVTVYNGCKIINTGETAVPMKGNIRVEDNATLVNTSVVGTGYFGGNSVTENANVQGCMYIKDNAIFAPTAEAGKSDSQIHLEGNARFLAAARTDVNVIKMSGNSVFSGIKASSAIVIDLRDNAEIQSRVSGSGTLVMKDDARVEAGTLSATGEITLCGHYKQTVSRSGFFGKRTITDVNAPDYDDNVKTEYDF